MLTVKKGSKSFYVGDSESAPLAEMIFSTDKDIITIEHTYVSDELRGQGAGRQLLQKLAAWVRLENKKIIAVCPFAKKELAKSQEYNDVLYQLPNQVSAQARAFADLPEAGQHFIITTAVRTAVFCGACRPYCHYSYEEREKCQL